MNRLAHQRHGFSLVELLIVIGIIALLIALLLPVLNKARFAAGQLQCLSNVRQLALATMAYCGENRGYYPRFDQEGGQHWTCLLFPYAGNSSKVFECPLVSDYGDAPAGGTLTLGKTVYTAHLGYKLNGVRPGGARPAGSTGPKSCPFGPCYTFLSSGYYIEEPNYLVDPTGNTPYYRTMKFGNVAPDTILIVDGFSQTGTGGYGDLSARNFGGGFSDSPWEGVTSLGIQSHNGKSVSIAFADNHAETVPYGTLIKDINYLQAGLQGYPTSNGGRPGDLDIHWNNTGYPFGYWSGDWNDNK
jgi:prepilin-type N-terminal cleavage/methylation domain-containing protein/prepilin-type processing-associated H-X9-DG protein